MSQYPLFLKFLRSNNRAFTEEVGLSHMAEKAIDSFTAMANQNHKDAEIIVLSWRENTAFRNATW
jgi:hypothetical protein